MGTYLLREMFIPCSVMEEDSMSWRQNTAIGVSALALLAGVSLATATPASAVGGCASRYLCVYDRTQFGGEKIVSASTNACFNLFEFLDFGSVNSYVNNLPVNAYLWEFDTGTGWSKARTLVAGKFSSSIPVNTAWSVCMGNARP
ncbi:peptidase inhibitor family I36 protein [Streptomyces sp. NPDC048142]|uniref:peptidase inhibitor family I36 protein n=1 Tax=Streptomyces sp. NPDC048142 TaxID=3365501 RepID=UPI003713D3D9